MMLKSGEMFGKYKVERMLGTGGMGAVYLVRHSVLDSLFALKILDAATAQKGGDFVTRFIREAKLASNIRHPNISAVHDAGQDEMTGLYYLVMDYLPGGTLRDRIHERGRIPAGEAVRIARQIAAALVTAHGRGMVHRDIKPENIMFAADGSAKLADLGIAKGTGEQDTLVTMASAVFGTPAYMAPEQATDSSSVDGRADIWSLGVVLYEMLSGVRPYEGNGLGAIVKQLLSDDPFPDVMAIAPEVPVSLAELVGDMCKKDVSQRVATARDLVERLASIDFGGLVLRKNEVQAGAARTMVTLATEATIQSVPAVQEPSVFVEPKLPTCVRDFEEQWERKIRRTALLRRLAIVSLLLICGLICAIVVRKNWGTDSRGAGERHPETKGTDPETKGSDPAEMTKETYSLGTGITPKEQGTKEQGTDPEEVGPDSKAQGTDPEQKPPLTLDNHVFLIGVAGEKSSLAALSGGAGRFVPISGKPDIIGRKIMAVMSQKPELVYVSLSGYAVSRDMSEARFEMFLREIAGGLASSQARVVLVAGTTAYGRIIRSVAKECSLDVAD